MTAPAATGAKVPAGTASPATLDNTFDIRGFNPGQPWFFSFYYQATRVSGTDTTTITSRMLWFDSTGAQLTATNQSVAFSATVAAFTFFEGAHIPPANAVRGRVHFTVSSTASTIGFDVLITELRVAKTQAGATNGATIGPGGNVTGAVDGNGRALVDLGQGGHLNVMLDNVADGTNYSRIAAGNVAGGAHIWNALNSRPANLAALTGAEQVNNAYGSMGANMITDTSFGAGWSLGNQGTRQTKNAASGFTSGVTDYCAQIAVDVATGGYVIGPDHMPVVPGASYAVHCNLQRNGAANGDANFGIWYYQVDGTFISSDAGPHITPASITAAAAPTRVIRTTTAPALAAYGVFRCFTYATASPAGAWRFEFPGFNPLVTSQLVDDASLGKTSNYIDGPTNYTVVYDSTGTTLQDSYELDYVLRTGTSGAAVTSGVTMTYTIVSGDLNGFTPASGAQSITVTGGVGAIPITSMTGSATTLKITVVNAGVTRTFLTAVTKTLAAATTSSGGGTTGSSTSQTSGFTQFSSAYSTPTQITSTFTFTPSSGQTTVSAKAVLTPRVTNDTASDGPWTVSYQWQQQVSGAWSNRGTAILTTGSGNSSPYAETDPELGKRLYVSGSINNTQTVTPTGTGPWTLRLVCWVSSTPVPDAGAVVSNNAPSGGGVSLT